MRAGWPMLLAGAALLASTSCGNSTDPVTPAADPAAPHALATLDDTCDGALTGRDVLNHVHARYDTTLQYLDPPGTTPLTITTSYDGGPITCQPAQRSTTPTGQDIVASVGVVVSIDVVSADGQLREHVGAVLSAAIGTEASWHAGRFTPDEVQGTWTPNVPGCQDVSWSLAGAFDGAHGRGTMSMSCTMPGHVPQGELVAQWRN